MKILGIESSCDECAAAVVEDGKIILSNVVATQIPYHAEYQGVVPEIASRMHTEWINRVVDEALNKASLKTKDINAIAATAHPGLLGSLLVGLSFAKAFAWARDIPFIAIDHMLAHLYAPKLEFDYIDYPFLGLLVSGGHTIICRADNFDDIKVLGTSIDDAIGEAFDKLAKHYSLGYPGGEIIDRLSKNGNPAAFNFPMPKLKGEHKYDVSYSGLKTAAINQLSKFRNRSITEYSEADIAASFQKAAVDILLRSLFNAIEDTGLKTIVAGGGVAANSYLREVLSEKKDLRIIFPSLSLCGDNAAMIAGLAYPYLQRGDRSPLNVTASAKVESFRNIRRNK